MIFFFLIGIYAVFWGCVILTLETLTLTALLGEQSTGLSMSDLLETISSFINNPKVSPVYRPLHVGLIGNFCPYFVHISL
jgi:hypothetical protein